MLFEPSKLLNESEDWFELRQAVWAMKLHYAFLLDSQSTYVDLVRKHAELIDLKVDIKSTDMPSKFNEVKSNFAHQSAFFVAIGFSRLWGSATEDKIRVLRKLYCSSGAEIPSFWNRSELSALECLIRASGDFNELFVGFIDHSIGDGGFHAACRQAEKASSNEESLFCITNCVTEAFKDPEFFSFAIRSISEWFPQTMTDVGLGEVYTIVNDEILASYKDDPQATPTKGAPPTANETALTSTANDARDKWLRDQKAAGKLTLSQIRSKLKTEHREWTYLSNDSSLNSAIRRYETRKGLEPIPKRKSKN